LREVARTPLLQRQAFAYSEALDDMSAGRLGGNGQRAVASNTLPIKRLSPQLAVNPATRDEFSSFIACD
jgi:hypothetical protein